MIWHFQKKQNVSNKMAHESTMSHIWHLNGSRTKQLVNQLSVQVFSITALIGDTEKSIKYCKLNKNFVKTQAC